MLAAVNEDNEMVLIRQGLRAARLNDPQAHVDLKDAAVAAAR